MSGETNVLVGVRDSRTWPRHKTKAVARKAARKSIARAAQRKRDAVRGEK
ncbi:hypothetical protein HYP71_gp048 [Arthrobacter phage KBurrousTX]|uniref:Uncharacterized protein n=1 Tax=Arthrobacter phage KBurrousTX TaxID=2315608 RepID=A0A386K9V3_9CAUD|nr:hypothetical protein HYP71_gp048 [Arthrobacter phage KBurrousTX]AYD81542.1 hypothetical protein KBurrousTX_48 [Arthrobacter phage KBurrousTX]